MIDLITGPFRSGKTGQVISRLKEELDAGRSPILAVPSRMQRDALSLRLSSALGKGYAGKVIYTLSEAVKESVRDLSEPLTVISDFECYILFKLLFEENRKKLRYFNNTRSGSGILKLIYSSITQMRDGILLRNSGTSPDGLFTAGESAAEGLLPKFAGKNPSAKWDDLALLFREYEKKLTSSGLCDTSLLLLKAADELDRNSPFAGRCSLLALDGFLDFTSCQFEFVKSLIGSFDKKGMPVLFTLPSTGSPVTDRTLNALKGTFQTRITEQGRPAEGFSSLAHAVLEKERKEKPFSLPVRTLCAFGKYREVELIGNEIKKLVAEKGLRYNEIAVIVRNPDSYSNTFRQVFREMDIPLYNSKDEPLKNNPVILFLYSIIRSVLQERSIDNIGLTALVRSNYLAKKDYPELIRNLPVFSAYFRGAPKDWEDEINAMITRYTDMRTRCFLEEEDTELTLDEITARIERLKKVKKELLSLLKGLFGLDKDFSIDDFLQWLSGVIDLLGIKNALNSPVGGNDVTALSAKDFTAFRKLLDTLRSMKRSLTIFKKEVFGGEEFFQLFDGLIRDITYRYQYYPADSVRVLTPFDARETVFRAVFIAGLNEGEFPGKPSSSLLDIRERRSFNDLAGRIVLENEESRGDTEKLDFAVALSRASDILYLSRTPYNESGSEILPSYFWSATVQWNPPCEEIELSEEMIPSEDSLQKYGGLYDRKTLARSGSDVLESHDIAALAEEYPFMASAVRMKKYTDEIDALNGHFEIPGAPDKKLPFGSIYAGHLDFSEDTGEDRENREYVLKKIAGKSLSSSLLETFGNCRYQYFLKYLLNIRPDAYPSQDIRSAFKGQFYHAVLKEYCERTKDLTGKQIQEQLEAINRMLDDIMEEQAEKYASKEGEKGLFSMEKEYYRTILRNFISYDAAELRDRQPGEMEKAISRDIDLGGGIFVNTVGSIDRVDEQKDMSGGHSAYRIIDYKSGGISHIKKNSYIPLKLFQGFVYAKAYAMETGRTVNDISYVSIETDEKDRLKDKTVTVFPYQAADKRIVSNFNELWGQKEKEIIAALELMQKGDFLPFTVESDYSEEVLAFYRPLKAMESDSKCSFCQYTDACPRRVKKCPDW